MTLEQLRIFVAAAEREHVTQAARDLNLTQSAVSAAIHALEARYAVKLFDRVGRRIALTQTGNVFLKEARGVLLRAADAEAALADLAGLKSGSLSIAASQTIGNYWLPPLALKFRAAYPGIALNIRISTTPLVADLVREGLVDLGLVEAEVDDPALSAMPMPGDELVVVVSSALALPAKAKPEALLKNLPWVLREKGSATRAMFERALKGLGLAARELNIVLELPSNEAVRTAVVTGAGAAALSRLVVADTLVCGALKQLDVALPKRRFFALKHREREATRAAQAFFALLKDNATRKP
ncbi:LysR family transcriptional regulator [Methylovirgula ligni]|uniref:LysR family transcriptional regulator n=1 Tax=Methylovirgula ligni TaxID=569860 RepID=A0A3D9Z2T3_9HYPH|nr:LysR family transcriptional regulator [Methylovirgula ligni]QAY95285.1 LysR family transcriptional regulator [Methylovirgula ligni]REF89411.1 LysR family transcriptional regulator [Methylovirgula ligni]